MNMMNIFATGPTGPKHVNALIATCVLAPLLAALRPLHNALQVEHVPAYEVSTHSAFLVLKDAAVRVQ